MPMTNETTTRALASAFATLLAKDLTPAEWSDMRRRNATPEYGGNICASHDFCDANMVMADAFLAVMGRNVLPDDGDPCEEDLALWSAAWSLAKREYLTA